MSVAPDYYKVLNIDRSAEPDEIRKAYRHLALKSHPERSNHPEAHKVFTSLAEAYDVLSDCKYPDIYSTVRKRAIYDQYGYEGLTNGVPARSDFDGYEGGYVFHGNAEEVFAHFFGGNNPFTDFFGAHGSSNSFGKNFGGLHGMNTDNALNKGPVKAEPKLYDLNVSLEELYNGALKKIKVNRKILGGNSLTTSEVDKLLTIEIKKGLKENTKLIFPSKGDQGPNKLQGDIVFILKELKHASFRRSGDDLIYTSKIPLLSALTGTNLSIKTLDGRFLNVPINETVEPKYTKVVAGEGMPNSKDPQTKGNLIINFETEYPTHIGDHQKKLLRKAFA